MVCLSGSCGVSSSPVHGRQVGVRPGISPPAINATGGARREAGVIGLLEGTHEPGCGVLAGSRLARRLPAASMRPVRRLLAAPLIALLAAACAAPAAASPAQLTFFEAGSRLLEPRHESATFAQLKDLGVHALRLELRWSAVAPAPTSARAPRFDATDPSRYAWGAYVSVVARAKALGWPVLLTVTGPAPRWATSNRRAPYVTRPDGLAFERFMTAVGREFSTKVALYSIWNEPNHPAFLMPQWTASGNPASPAIYRHLYQHGYDGLLAAGLRHPKVLFGETAPAGYTRVTPSREGLLHAVAPLAFLRSAFCLDSGYRRAGSCAKLQIAGFADHPYSKAVGPTWVPPGGDDVTIGSLSRLSSALDGAAAAGAIPAATPIYLTEFGVQSYPNRRLGVPVATQAEYDAVAERIAYDNPRVAGFSQYLLRDDPLGGAPGASVHGGTVGFQTGLEYASGGHKPLYEGWRLPLAVYPRSGGSSLWGLVRPSSAPTTVSVLAGPSSSRLRILTHVRTDPLGYWTLETPTSAAVWRVRWRSPAGRTYEGAAVAPY